jgi:small-conductance mechanosensitive channel
MTDPTTAAAAITAVVYAALLAGHMLGDHPVQSDNDAAGKGHPTDDRLAAGARPWAGWIHCLRHCTSYLICQACALLLIGLVAPLSFPGFVAALAISGSTHAVIDRRWIVRRILAAKGGCPGWPQASYFIDQSLHYAAMLIAAVAAARAATTLAATVVTGAGVLLVAAALAAERHHGRAVTARPVPTDHL